MTPEHVKPVTFLREIDSVTLTQIRSCTSHGKAHSGVGASRKGTLCVTARMQNAPFGEVRDQSAVFREGDDPRMRFPVTPASQSALFREPSVAECAFP